jgi:hypothetical protein
MRTAVKRLLRSPLLERVAYAAVGLAVFSLPITGLPALAAMMGGPLVAPPSAVFVFLLLVGWLPIYLLRKGTLPGEMRPWLAFGGVALLSSALAFFLPMPSFKNHTVLPAEMDGLLTFGIAAAFFLVFATWIRRPRHLEWVFRWINLGGFVLLAWCLAQLFYILFRNGSYSGFMVDLQSFVSVRWLEDHIYYNRLAGFSYEPSWLAHQLNVVYLPFWMAATLTGYSAHRKLWKLSIENVLLAVGILALVFTYSRVGLLAFLLVVAYGIYRLNKYGIQWLQRRLKLQTRWARVWVTGLALAFVFVVYGLLVYGLLSLLARSDARIASLLQFRAVSSNLMDIAYQIDFAERVIYWANGWLIFARFPLFGVGLGNAGFFFSGHLHLLGYRSGEILQVLYDAPYLPNIKSMWLRIPAETGLAGFGCFLAGYYILWRAGHNLTRHSLPALRVAGWMGLFVLLSFLAEGFSIDSFALPYLWVSLGVLAAASAMGRRTAAGSDREAPSPSIHA